MSSGAFRVGGDAYDDFMGRYSVSLAKLFADFVGVDSGVRALDVGAGTGALTGELVSRGVAVAAADPSPEFVALCWHLFITFQEGIGDAEEREAPGARSW